jgi:hypothetical protein
MPKLKQRLVTTLISLEERVQMKTTDIFEKVLRYIYCITFIALQKSANICCITYTLCPFSFKLTEMNRN